MSGQRRGVLPGSRDEGAIVISRPAMLAMRCASSAMVTSSVLPM